MTAPGRFTTRTRTMLRKLYCRQCRADRWFESRRVFLPGAGWLAAALACRQCDYPAARALQEASAASSGDSGGRGPGTQPRRPQGPCRD